LVKTIFIPYSLFINKASYTGEDMNLLWTRMPTNEWVIAFCDATGCGYKGMFFDGGKKEKHFCPKHNPRL